MRSASSLMRPASRTAGVCSKATGVDSASCAQDPADGAASGGVITPPSAAPSATSSPPRAVEAPRDRAGAAHGRVRAWRSTSTSTPWTRSPARSARRSDPAIRRPHRLSDRLVLRPRVLPRQPRGQGAHPADPAPRRQAPFHARLRRLRAAGPVRPPRQRGVPRHQGGDAGPLHLHPPRDEGGAPAAAPREEEDRRRAHPRAPGRPRAPARTRRADPVEHAPPARRRRADDRGLGDQGPARPRRSTPSSTRGSAASSRRPSSTSPTATRSSPASGPATRAPSSSPFEEPPGCAQRRRPRRAPVAAAPGAVQSGHDPRRR